jgi:cytochrome c oxidase subunit II
MPDPWECQHGWIREIYMSNRIHFIIVTILIILATAGTYFVLTAIYQLPIRGSAEAIPIDQLFQGHFFIIAFLFSLIMVMVLYSSVVFRRRPGETGDGVHFHGHTGLEVGWTIIPIMVVIGFTIWGARVLGQITEPVDNEMVINVTAQQWSWTFAYPEHEVGPLRELVLPVNQPVRLQMRAPDDDVIHAFWVPEFRVKQDVVPGRITTLRITPTVVGSYQLLCAEICGFGHADMRANVHVLNQVDFDAWLLDQAVVLADLTPEERGEKWAGDFGCDACHSFDGTTRLGPTWLGLYGSERIFSDGTSRVADEAYLRESILEPDALIVLGFPPGIMPGTYGEQFAAVQADILQREGVEIDIIDDLIAFIRTLEE